jgi:hypothetical protein
MQSETQGASVLALGMRLWLWLLRSGRPYLQGGTSDRHGIRKNQFATSPASTGCTALARKTGSDGWSALKRHVAFAITHDALCRRAGFVTTSSSTEGDSMRYSH